MPLILLTADRPPELRDRGAPQTIDQVRMFGRFVRWDAELPVPSDDPIEHRPRPPRRRTSGRDHPAVRAAGPVHLDLPYREPLIPDGTAVPQGTSDARWPLVPFTRVHAAASVQPAIAELVAHRMARARRPAIWCGPLDDPMVPDALARLAATLGAPILADGLSNLRVGQHDRSHVIARTATVLRSPTFVSDHQPDLILRFGGTPTSRATLEWLADSEAEHIVVDDGGWNEPALHASTFVHADPGGFAVMLADANDLEPSAEPGWLEAWSEADWTRRSEPSMPRSRPSPRAVSRSRERCSRSSKAPCRTCSILWAGSSMPVRDLDTFLPAGDTLVRCLSNRGANGIDGVVSSALGAAAAEPSRPVLLVLGDISFLHDINALATARVPGARLTILLVDNDGGGIFSFLPQATADRDDVGLPSTLRGAPGHATRHRPGGGRARHGRAR